MADEQLPDLSTATVETYLADLAEYGVSDVVIKVHPDGIGYTVSILHAMTSVQAGGVSVASALARAHSRFTEEISAQVKEAQELADLFTDGDDEDS